MKQRVLLLLLLFCSFCIEADDTVLKLYRPYGDVMDKEVPKVAQTVSGHCLSQSRLIIREDAWRCEAEGKTYDPCFVKAGDNRTEALCPQSPWADDGIQITLSSPLNNEQNEALDMSQTYPWGMELANGERCLAIHSTELYDEMPVRYRCTNKNFLVGHLQRCDTVWSMLEKTPQGVVTVEVAKAWF